MEFKQDTIGDILTSEHEMVLHGAESYGDYFINASEFNCLLQEFIKSVDSDRFIFANCWRNFIFINWAKSKNP